MNRVQRDLMQLLVSSLIGLELWRIGESELPRTAEDDFMRLRARLLVYEAMLWPKKGENSDQCEDSDVPF